MSNCLFCKFANGELEVKKVFEDENMIIIRDIAPQAKNHFLMIPKEHYALLEDMNDNQAQKFLACIKKLKTLKKELELDDGFRIIINQGENGGQSVHHVHVHILSGEKLGWEKN